VPSLEVITPAVAGDFLGEIFCYVLLHLATHDIVYRCEIQESGVKSLRGIARALAARGIPTARCGEWTAVQVSAIVYRANDWFRRYQRGL
jgi:hypothetical protein